MKSGAVWTTILCSVVSAGAPLFSSDQQAWPCLWSKIVPMYCLFPLCCVCFDGDAVHSTVLTCSISAVRKQTGTLLSSERDYKVRPYIQQMWL
jgi:hypothetical protein